MRSDILNGLRMALLGGQSLQEAMQSLYNAGYKKEEIEEAAQYVYTSEQPSEFNQSSQPIQSTPISSPSPIPTNPIPSEMPIPQQQLPIQQPIKQIPQQTIQPVQQPSPVIIQKVSNYGEEPKKKRSFMIIFLIAILVLLFISIISLFIFKDSMIDFLSKLFG